MNSFTYVDSELTCDGVRIADVASEHGTPVYVYSAAAIRNNFRALRDAFAPINPLICYAVKANFSLAICKLLKDEGAGFDIVSGGELFRALKAGADAGKICYAGVGKTREEIASALKAGILLFNVESAAELARIDEVARSMGKTAEVALRLNPDVDAKTHVHTTTGKKGTKFGMDFDAAFGLMAEQDDFPAARMTGVHVHIGSPVYTVAPYTEALERLLVFIERCRAWGHKIEWLDVGGGFGIEYQGGETAKPADYAAAIIPLVKRSGCRAIIEPGRFIVGNAGVLVTSVQYVKESHGKKFLICDAGMNDLIRPALYSSYHRIWPVKNAEPVPRGSEALAVQKDRVVVDVVGPVCESGDFFAKDRPLPPIRQDELLAIFSAGAYGFSMSSNYNSRPRPCEVMIEDGKTRIIRERESYDDLVAREKV